ncbi:M23 family metallopeptidase [Rhodanobacter sp. L36]|uniref:M23 family metallopeptidase n=1 Tax=Rhodanobacter sp. L36 TaxID=1747221 RepID=UPI001C208EAD|nr:M23 family metallopeptidase [Rhodanobacter sp. L36]
MAPVEVRNTWAPQVVTGSDGVVHLAYELHLLNFYGDTGVLQLRHVGVFDGTSKRSLATFEGPALEAMMSPHAPEGAKVGAALSIKSGAQATVFIWLDLPKGTTPPATLRHRLEFETAKGTTTSVDGARVYVDTSSPVVLGAPLRGGFWVATEGPGNSRSHHWGSTVVVNGQLTVPQRYAVDLIGVDAGGHAVRAGAGDLRQSKHADWIGFGADVLAVADGMGRSTHDGAVDHPPLSPQDEPASLTADGLYGNYVVLEISPHVFAHYAHLQHGSVVVKAGQHVHRGDVLGHVGQSGNSGGPHLHFQVSNAPTFEGSEGIPFVFDHFTRPGIWSVNQAIDSKAVFHATSKIGMHRKEMPLDNDVIGFSTDPRPSK